MAATPIVSRAASTSAAATVPASHRFGSAAAMWSIMRSCAVRLRSRLLRAIDSSAPRPRSRAGGPQGILTAQMVPPAPWVSASALLEQPARHEVGHEGIDVGADRVGRGIRRLGHAIGDRLAVARGAGLAPDQPGD